MKVHYGIQVYEILENGNLLSGIYTNRGLLKRTPGLGPSAANDYYIKVSERSFSFTQPVPLSTV